MAGLLSDPTALLSIIGLIVLTVLAWRTGLIDAAIKALNVYKLLADGLERRVTELERRNAALDAKVTRRDALIADLREEAAQQDAAMLLLVRNIARAGVCGKALRNACDDFEVPDI